MIKAVYQIKWTEFERGWGQREAGETYYINKKEADKEYNKAFEDRSDYVPDYYINPSKPKLIEVSKELYQKIKKTARKNAI